MIRIGLMALLLALPAGPAAVAQPARIEVQGVFTHIPTGMAFPPAVDEFRRVGVMDYGRDGQNVSAGYQAGEGPDRIVVTVYIYPGLPVPPGETREHMCDTEFEVTVSQIAIYPGARVLKRDRIPSPSAQHSVEGHRAIYSVDSLPGGTPGPLRTEADLFCSVNGRWSIKYRITAAAHVSYEAALARLMKSLVWPAPPTI